MSARHRGVSTEARADGTSADLDAEGPLRRWARRKGEAARERKAADEARRGDASSDRPEAAHDGRGSTGEASESAGVGEVVEEAVEEKVLTDEDMPSLDILDENSDYSGFLSPGVSEGLRRRALRKLFSSAVFNVPDGLDDYDDDFTSFAALGDIVTSDMKHQAEMEAERAKRARADAEPAAGHDDESAGVEGQSTGVEDESGEVEDERLAHAGEDAEGLADAESAGPPESSEHPVHEDSDAPGGAEAAASASKGGRRET